MIRRKKRKKCEGTILNGKLNGNCKYYVPSGFLWKEENYVDHKRNGICKEYWIPNNEIMVESYYNDDKKHGIFRAYHKNGKIWEEVNYNDGKMNGILHLLTFKTPIFWQKKILKD